jgi:hypothetical protein
MNVHRVTVEISESAYQKLMAEASRRARREGRGKSKYPTWRIVDEALHHFLTELEPEAEAVLLEEEATHANR